MAGITLEQAEAKLQQYLAAEEAVLTGQQYQIAGRMLRRADLNVIQEGITLWNERVKELSVRRRGGRRAISPLVRP